MIDANLDILKKIKNGRRLIEEKNLSKNEYIYAKQHNNKWLKSDGSSYRFDKVFIRKNWLDEKLAEEDDNSDSDDDIVSDSEDDENNDSYDESDNDDKSDEILMAPGIIKLSKSEKMKDNNGKILDVEIRGTRDHDNCFFKVDDVAKGFGMKKLYSVLIHKNAMYKKNIHYRYFYFSKNVVNYGKNKKVEKVKKVKKIFLTYTGLLKVLFSSRNKSVNNFVGWATETLFTAHLGTKDKKDALASTLMGVSSDIVKEVFNKTSSTLPTLYLLSIGKVKDLRVSLKIGKEYDDEMIVCKGGETDDLTRRFKEHIATYGKMPGANLCLKWFNYIDPQYKSKAETELFKKFELMGYLLPHAKYEELLIFGKKDIKNIIGEYDNVALKYTGHIKEVKDKIKDLENHIVILKKEKENDLLRKDNQINVLKKELELKDKELELKDKDLELKDRLLEIMKKDLEIINLKRSQNKQR